MRAIHAQRPRGVRSFTLLEILTVLVIVSVLAGLLLAGGDVAKKKAAASRAHAEIAALAAALEKYKLDNDKLPATATIATNAVTGYTANLSTYRDNAAALFGALAGRVHFTDSPTGTVYYEFKRNQVSANSTNSTEAGDCVIDPFKNPYGFTTDVADVSANVVYNKGFFDLWSTAGQPATAPQTNNWISNWKDGS